MSSENARKLRDLTGFGMQDCVRALRAAEEHGGDVLLALAVIDAAGLAIHVKGDRDAWNRARAVDIAARWRERSPELDAAFPKPAPAPSEPVP